MAEESAAIQWIHGADLARCSGNWSGLRDFVFRRGQALRSGDGGDLDEQFADIEAGVDEGLAQLFHRVRPINAHRLLHRVVKEGCG